MSAGFWRRFAALIYDALLIVALSMVYTGIALLFTHGEAIVTANAGSWTYVYRAGLLFVSASYYVLCCQQTGHTLGMRAWRLRTQDIDGELMSRSQALLRFATGVLAWLPFALGVFWLYLDPHRLAIHDRLSRSRVVVLSTQ